MLNMLGDIAFEGIEAEIKEFLQRYPVPSPDRKLDDFGARSLGLAKRHRKALSRAIEECSRYMEGLKPFRDVLAGYGELAKALLERKNALARELQRFQVV